MYSMSFILTGIARFYVRYLKLTIERNIQDYQYIICMEYEWINEYQNGLFLKRQYLLNIQICSALGKFTVSKLIKETTVNTVRVEFYI